MPSKATEWPLETWLAMQVLSKVALQALATSTEGSSLCNGN